MKKISHWGFYLFTGSILFILFALLFLWSFIEWKSYPGEKDLEQVFQKLSDQGEHFTLKDLGLDQPTIPSPGYYKIEELHKKLGKLQKKASVEIVSTKHRYISPGKVQSISMMESPSHIEWRRIGQKGNPSWQDLQTQAEFYAPHLKQITKIFESEPVTFGIDYNKGLKSQQPHLLLMSDLAKIYTLHSLSHLKNQNYDLVITNIKSLFLLSSSLEETYLPVAKFHQLWVIDLAHLVTWQLLQQQQISESQLKQLSLIWNLKTCYSNYSKAIEVERIFIIQIWNEQKLLRDLPYSHSYEAYSLEGLKERKDLIFYKTLYSSQDKIILLQTYQHLIDRAKSINNGTTIQKEQKKWNSKFRSTHFHISDNYNQFLLSNYFHVNAYSLMFTEILETETKIRQTQIAIALKQFQLKHNSLPKDLSELTPHFLLSIPVDPFDGKPMRYQRKSHNSFLLYGIGEDFIDDGGDPTSKTPTSNHYYRYRDGKDLVWPRP